MLDDDFKRKLLDPKGEYPADGLRQVEELAWQVLQLSPTAVISRTRDVIQIDMGGAEGIVVLVTAEALELRLPTVEWTMGAYGPAEASRFWKRISARRMNDLKLAELLESARQARREEYKTCQFCKEQFPPEFLSDESTCQGCAEKYLGVVY